MKHEDLISDLLKFVGNLLVTWHYCIVIIKTCHLAPCVGDSFGSHLLDKLLVTVLDWILLANAVVTVIILMAGFRCTGMKFTFHT